MSSPACGHDNPPGARFCNACGAAMEASCPACGSSNPPAARFCNGCGAGLGSEERQTVAQPFPLHHRGDLPRHLAEKILTSRSAAEGERKQVTVLFADVKGSMELGEKVDPEEWYRIMDRFFQILSDGVHRFEGTVDKFTGDGIMAIFGAAMFLSLRVGVIAMVPNVFPIVIFLGLMGVTGADLNLATNMIASIALGIAVDDTIHLMSRLSAEVRTSGEQERAVLDTLASVGKPALYASLLIILGFLTLLFSSFVPIRQFGMLSATTIVFALFGEILLTPALLSTTRFITLWDVLNLKLGRDPHKTIGIFHDLGPWQARMVALLGELRSFPHGQPIIRQGETGDAMFVIINGRAEVSYDSGNERRHVRELGRGDVFGEMGLIRRHERTADVVAIGEVETMAMNEQFLSRLQRRYPRIANRILVNVARVLADRLQEETTRRA